MRRWITGSYPLMDAAPAGGNGTTAADIEATVQRLLDSKGDKGAIAELLRDNFKQREEIRTLNGKLEAAPKVAEGGLILNPEEAKAYQAYLLLGKPEDVKKQLDSKVELEQKVQAAERKDAYAAAAEAHGLNVSVLTRLAEQDKLKVEVREETVDGQKVKVAYVTEPTQGAIPKKLTDHADAAWKEFLPALQAEAEEGSDREARKTKSAEGTAFTRQQPIGSSSRTKRTEDDFQKATRATVDYSL